MDYTDIESKIEDANNALDSLYNLIYGQYNGVFSGTDNDKLLRMLNAIKGASRCMDEVSELNTSLSDRFEEMLHDVSRWP